MLRSSQKQRGMTAIAMLMLLALIGFNAMVIIKLMPTYLDSFKVSSALNGLLKDNRAADASNAEIKALLIKKLQIDDIDDITPDDIIIEESRSGRLVSIDFERRIPMFGNLDVIIPLGDDAVELR